MSKVLWTKCDQCGSILYIKHLKEHYHVCLNCSHHLQPCDPLNFKDQKAYSDRLVEAQERTGLKDAVQTGIGNIEGIPVALGVMDFHFMGGSMGSVVGEKITRLIEHATQLGLPVILVCASGGARMQEGILSLMQMAKISAALHVHQHEANLFYLSVLTSPTTGGVTASFAMLGDLILAEPKALIGFAGRRVIEQTLQEKLPDNFQTSEYLLKHGLLDLIVPRPLLKQALAELLILYKEAPLKRRGQISYGVKKGLYPEFDKKLRQEWRKKPNETTLKKVFDSLKSEGFSLSEEKFKELMTSQEGNSDSLFEKALQLVSKSGVEWSLPSK